MLRGPMLRGSMALAAVLASGACASNASYLVAPSEPARPFSGALEGTVWKVENRVELRDWRTQTQKSVDVTRHYLEFGAHGVGQSRFADLDGGFWFFYYEVDGDRLRLRPLYQEIDGGTQWQHDWQLTGGHLRFEQRTEHQFTFWVGEVWYVAQEVPNFWSRVAAWPQYEAPEERAKLEAAMRRRGVALPAADAAPAK